MSRVYTFDSILNFRDFGDYSTRDGGRVKKGTLFRSANFSRASREDLQKLADLNISLRVDMRYAAERQKQPSRWPQEHRTKFLDYPDEFNANRTLAPHEMFIKEQLNDPDDARQYMRDSYAARIHDSGFQHLVKSTFEHMSQTSDPIVIHCAAGKDRTGTLAAIILMTLGVDQETIMEDYMMTMDVVDIESYLEPAAIMMSKKHGRTISKEALRPMFGVEPEYLVQSLEAIGDLVDYLRTILVQKEITSKLISKFVGRLS